MVRQASIASRRAGQWENSAATSETNSAESSRSQETTNQVAVGARGHAGRDLSCSRPTYTLIQASNSSLSPHPQAFEAEGGQRGLLGRIFSGGRSNRRRVEPSFDTGDRGLSSGATARTDIIDAWRQGSTGNCVTIGAIKAAQARFGPELAVPNGGERYGVFQSAEYDENGALHVVMRDGFSLTVSASELATAKELARFRSKGQSPEALKLLENARIIYGVVAKRAQLEGNDEYRAGQASYSGACRTLNNGEITYFVREHFGRLGLGEHARRIPRSELSQHTYGLASGYGHAYFVTGGHRDQYGRDINLGRGHSHAWILEPAKPMVKPAKRVSYVSLEC